MTVNLDNKIYGFSLLFSGEVKDIRAEVETKLLQAIQKKLPHPEELKTARQIIETVYPIFKKKIDKAYSKYLSLEKETTEAELKGYKVVLEMIMEKHKKYFESDLKNKVQLALQGTAFLSKQSGTRELNNTGKRQQEKSSGFC